MSDEQLQQPEEHGHDAEGMGAGERLPEVKALEMLVYTIQLFADLAWIKLGIKASPASGEVQADYPEARLAIDAIAALVPLTEGRIDAHAVRDLRNLLTTLQMNYVQRASGGQ